MVYGIYCFCFVHSNTWWLLFLWPITVHMLRNPTLVWWSNGMWLIILNYQSKCVWQHETVALGFMTAQGLCCCRVMRLGLWMHKSCAKMTLISNELFIKILRRGAAPDNPAKGRCPLDPRPLTGQRNPRLTLRSVINRRNLIFLFFN